MRTISIFPIFSSQKKEEKIPETSDQGDRYLFRGWFLKLNHFFLYHSYHFFFCIQGVVVVKTISPQIFFSSLIYMICDFFFPFVDVVCVSYFHTIYTQNFSLSIHFFSILFFCFIQKKYILHSQPSRELNIPIYQKKAQTSEKYFFFSSRLQCFSRS